MTDKAAGRVREWYDLHMRVQVITPKSIGCVPCDGPKTTDVADDDWFPTSQCDGYEWCQDGSECIRTGEKPPRYATLTGLKLPRWLASNRKLERAADQNDGFALMPAEATEEEPAGDDIPF